MIFARFGILLPLLFLPASGRAESYTDQIKMVRALTGSPDTWEEQAYGGKGQMQAFRLILKDRERLRGLIGALDSDRESQRKAILFVLWVWSDKPWNGDEGGGVATGGHLIPAYAHVPELLGEMLHRLTPEDFDLIAARLEARKTSRTVVIYLLAAVAQALERDAPLRKAVVREHGPDFVARAGAIYRFYDDSVQRAIGSPTVAGGRKAGIAAKNRSHAETTVKRLSALVGIPFGESEAKAATCPSTGESEEHPSLERLLALLPAIEGTEGETDQSSATALAQAILAVYLNHLLETPSGVVHCIRALHAYGQGTPSAPLPPSTREDGGKSP